MYFPGLTVQNFLLLLFGGCGITGFVVVIVKFIHWNVRERSSPVRKGTKLVGCYEPRGWKTLCLEWREHLIHQVTKFDVPEEVKRKSGWSIDQFRYVKIQPKTIVFSTRL